MLEALLRDRVDIDNVLVLGSNDQDPPGLRSFLNKYRRLVNENLLYVNVDLRSVLFFSFSISHFSVTLLLLLLLFIL